MKFLQDFHTELSKCIATKSGRFIWRIERSVFEEIEVMAGRRGMCIEPDSHILFLPFEIGATSTGTVELVRR